MDASLSDVRLRENSNSLQNTTYQLGKTVFVRIDSGLVSINAAKLIAHYARNAQTFTERIHRLIGISLIRFICPVICLWDKTLGTRLLHFPLRGMSRDRLDLLGEEYFQYKLCALVKPEGIALINQLLAGGSRVVLVSGELDHLLCPLARYLRVDNLVSNRLEFRNGRTTGRLISPVLPYSRLKTWWKTKLKSLGPQGLPTTDLEQQIQSTSRKWKGIPAPVVNFSHRKKFFPDLSIRRTLAGKHILLIGGTGFIGKVWVSMLLHDLPEIGRIYLLIRRQASRTALQRFEKIIAESPTFASFHDRFGDRLADFLMERVEVLEGDISALNFGLDEKTFRRLCNNLDLVVNSAGLTDFNPDLGLAMTTNVDGVLHVTKFLKHCRRAALLHVSTCFVNGRTDGRVPEELLPNYTPAGNPDFDASREREFIHHSIQSINKKATTRPIVDQVRLKVKSRQSNVVDSSRLIRKERNRWIRDQGIEFGIQRAHHWGWPNIYTFTKSIGESILATEDLPIAIVRPSIVESSISQPFRGWNEGVNTTAPLSYLLSTYFRQLPSNKRKRLDVIPVDLVCRGLTLISAALIQRRHERVYHLATSATNPTDMRRTIELTCLAHRKYYRSLEGLEHWLRARCDTIPVSKTRYRHASLPRLRTMLQGLQHLLGILPVKNESLTRKQRALDRVYKVIELYQPFILDNEYIFAADHIRELGAALPSNEVEVFGYHPERIDWYDYWINLHVPALRRWTYPIIEGRRPETGLLPRNFQLPTRSTSGSSTNDPGSALADTLRQTRQNGS